MTFQVKSTRPPNQNDDWTVMKFTLSWLKDHLDTDASLDIIETTLSSIGLEVEGIDSPADATLPEST